MSRKRKTDPYVQQKISIDAALMARFTLIYWDPTLRKMKYGAVSQVINTLLSDHVNKIESGIVPPQPILSDSEQRTVESL